MARKPRARDTAHPHTVLVSKGAGAPGAYQASVLEALQGGGITPNWLVGTSIGAINAALALTGDRASSTRESQAAGPG